jgi:2-succinyl-5-enolpyruvyl-6-hydroxy-3-cyclohexene-1-carboxylate synthase
MVDLSLGLDPASTLSALATLGRATPDPEWLQSWRAADAGAAIAISETLADELSEPRVAAELGAVLPPQAIVFVASSMPVRDVETFVGVRDDPPRVLANRGANGIDGLISCAYGVASARQGPVVLLLGDVAFAHDIGGLLAGGRLGIPLTVVVLDNGGGGIFDFLPVATQTDVFEEHVATPTGLDLAHAAALYGARHVPVDSLDGLRTALEEAEGTTILHVRTSRSENVALHRRVWDAVSAALPR